MKLNIIKQHFWSTTGAFLGTIFYTLGAYVATISARNLWNLPDGTFEHQHFVFWAMLYYILQMLELTLKCWNKFLDKILDIMVDHLDKEDVESGN